MHARTSHSLRLVPIRCRRKTRAIGIDHAAAAGSYVLDCLEQRVLLSAATSAAGFAQPWEGRDAYIVPMGHSDVAGVVGQNSFRRNLWHMLQSAGFDVDFVGSKQTNSGGLPTPNPDFDLDNEGHGGWRADQLLTGRDGAPGLSQWLQNYTPDIVLLYIGINDFNQGQSVASTVNDISMVIDVLRADNPDVIVLLGNSLKSARWPATTALLPQFNQQLADLAVAKSTDQSPIVLVDHYASDFDPYTDTTDLHHPNDVGEYKFARNWFAALEPILRLAGQPPTTQGPGQIIVSQPSGSSTTEGGGSVTFTVKLNRRPTTEVFVGLSVSDATEARLSQTGILFTPTNWNQPVQVTVTGLDDDAVDGDISYVVKIHAAQSADLSFHGAAGKDIALINRDNDVPSPPPPPPPPPPSEPEPPGPQQPAVVVSNKVNVQVGKRKTLNRNGNGVTSMLYRIRLNKPARLFSVLNDSTGNVRMRLMRPNGRVLADSYRPGIARERFQRLIGRGVFIIRLDAMVGTLAQYKLDLLIKKRR